MIAVALFSIAASLVLVAFALYNISINIAALKSMQIKQEHRHAQTFYEPRDTTTASTRPKEEARAETLPPEALAPFIRKPPRSPGGFGSIDKT